MKLDPLNLVVNQPGSVTIVIDDIEDFWTLANVLRIGDHLTSPIRRKIVKVSGTGKTDSRQLLTKATVKIVEVDFQAGVNEMQLRGTLVHDLEDAREGSSQRVLLEPGRAFTLHKQCWDKFAYQEITEAANPTLNASVAAVIMQSGLAHICIIGRNTTVVKQKVQKAIPKVKKHGSSGKNMESKFKFFAMTAEALAREININQMKCIICASPGFIQHEFLQYLRENCVKYNIPSQIIQQKFVEASVSTGHPQELEALLAQPTMQAHVSELRAAQQAKAFEVLMREMNKSIDMVLFGETSVLKAASENAIKSMMVTDKFIRSQPLNNRLSFLELKDRLEQSQVEVVVFSTRHGSGEQLDALGGIAALLKFAIVQEESGFDQDFDD